MIGYCHYLEAAGGEIALPLDGISDIRRVRGLVEKRLNEYSAGVGPVYAQSETCQTQSLIALKRDLKRYPKIKEKFDAIEPADDSLKVRPELKAFYSDQWANLVEFRQCDAAKPEERYNYNNGNDITHIYSYNKVMSEQDRAGICKILNRTNYKILAWYFGPQDTERSGLRDFKCLGRMPMSSTGGQRFTVYVYFRTFKYVKGIEQAWDKYDEDEDEDDDQKSEGPLTLRCSKFHNYYISLLCVMFIRADKPMAAIPFANDE